MRTPQTRAHAYTGVLTWADTHPPTHTFIYISYLTRVAAPTATVSLSLPLMWSVREVRGQGSPLDLCSLLLPSSEAISGLTGDITQRPQPYISMVHRRSNVTPSNNTARPATGLEGGVLGVLGQVMLWPKGGQGGVGHRPRR